MLYQGYDREGLDAQYFMRARHPDWEDYFNKWEAWGKRVREQRRCRLDVTFGDNPDETVDIFPAERADAPIHVFIHGGYWQAMNKTNFSYIADGFVDAGASLVIINYTLAPAADIGEIVRQCRAAMAWTWRNSDGIGDRNRIYVSGHSAGGHLTAMMMATDWPSFGEGLPADLAKGGCAISGLFDLEAMRLCYVNDKLQLTEDQVARHSPVHVPPTRIAPLIIAVGSDETEEFHRQAAVYAGRCQENGLSPDVMTLPGINHYSIVGVLGEPDHDLTHAIHVQMGTAS